MKFKQISVKFKYRSVSLDFNVYAINNFVIITVNYQYQIKSFSDNQKIACLYAYRDKTF